MPFPLGHTAIGLAAFETARKSDSCGSRLGLFVYITVLANLPDLDVLAGLLIKDNGTAFHRGPTHSLLFAVIAGYLASRIGRWWRYIPRLEFGVCTLLIFSHVAADLLLTSAPVSLFWPLEVHWSLGYSGWASVLHQALFQSVQDLVIAAGTVIYLFALRQVRGSVCVCSGIFAQAPKRVK